MPEARMTAMIDDRDAVTVAATVGNALLDPHACVDALELLMRENLEVLDIDAMTRHHFALGTYAREIRIPAGTLITGKIHKTRHINIISAGRISVWSPGEDMRHISAPYTFVAEPGTRRVGYAHEDTVWTTIHATHETDLAKIEAEFIEPHEPALALRDRVSSLHLVGEV
jgi:hypothetical protein